jgi:uncharacterized membrane protein
MFNKKLQMLNTYIETAPLQYLFFSLLFSAFILLLSLFFCDFFYLFVSFRWFIAALLVMSAVLYYNNATKSFFRNKNKIKAKPIFFHSKEVFVRDRFKTFFCFSVVLR